MRRSDKPAPTGNAVSRFGIAVALLLIWLLILILGAPLNHDGRRQVLRSGHPGMDAGVAATRPWMADRGGPTEQCLTAGMPSLGEAPSGGARARCLRWRSSKVSRRKGGTLSGRNRSNGYVHIPRRRYLWPPRAIQLPQGSLPSAELCATPPIKYGSCAETPNSENPTMDPSQPMDD